MGEEVKIKEEVNLGIKERIRKLIGNMGRGNQKDANQKAEIKVKVEKGKVEEEKMIRNQLTDKERKEPIQENQ